ncbi:MAG: hypothetical protein ACREH6_05120 [Geminicoccaceae bacterium]
MAERSAPSREVRRLGYEPTDASIKVVLWVVVGWIAFVVVGALALGGLLGLFDVLRAPSPVGPLGRVELTPPEPRLEANPKQTLERVRQHEDQLLAGYAWIDRKAGRARIPIDRAMQLLAERGWPPEGAKPSPEQAERDQ